MTSQYNDILSLVHLDLDEYENAQKYIDTLADIVSKRFKYTETRMIKHYKISHEYTYKNLLRLHAFILRHQKRTNRELLICLYHEYFYISNIVGIITSTYKSVKIEDLELYLDLSDADINCGDRPDVSKIIQLIPIYKKLTNLSIDEFIFETEQYISRNPGEDIFPKLEGHIIRINNSKISELWWLWKNYSGIYSNYIEWLPRETLDDTIMIQHSGIPHPDYATYIQ